MKNSTFKVGETEYNTLRTWTNATYDNCTFEKGFDLDLAGSAENLAVTNSKFSDGTPVDITLFRANDTEKYNITVDGIKMSYDAKIGDTYYTTLAEAIAEGGEVVLLQDITFDSTIKVNGTVVLDLNGKTITGTDNATKNFALIEVQPGKELTINDTVGTGKITLTATNDRDFNNYSSVISNQRGKLTVNGGTIEHLGGTDMAYGIDNLTNGKGTYAETVINGGTIKSTYRGIRQFLNGVEAQNILTVNGGTIEGANKSIWMQDPSAKANSGTLTVGENAELKGDVYLYVTPGSTEWPVSVSIAAAALNGESTVITGNVPHGYVVEEANGAWGVREANYVAKVGEDYFETLAAAITAANANDTIVLIDNVTENVTIGKNITIDGEDKNYTGKMSISKSINLTIDNVNFIEGNIVKGNSTGTTGTYTIKNCSFDSESNAVYAIEIRGSTSIIIENCTSEGYYGLLQVPSSNNSVSIKDVTINDTGYAIKVDYSNGVSLENVTIENSTYGFVNSNFGTKTITVKNCTIKADYPLVIWDRDTKAVNTFKFEGINDFGTNEFFYNKVTEDEMAYTKYVLTEGATLTAVAGLDVTTNVENHLVKYDNGTYKVIPAVAQVGETIYETVSEALAEAAKMTGGATVTLIANADADVVVVYPGVTLDLNGKTLNANHVIGLNGSDVIDNSDENTGLLVVADKENVVLAKDNAQLPVWNGENGYMFAKITMQTLISSQTSDSMTIKYRPRFSQDDVFDGVSGMDNRYFADGTSDNAVDIAIRIEWNDEVNGVTGHQQFVYIDTYSSQIYGSDKTGVLVLTLTGTSGYSGLRVFAYVVSDTGVICEVEVKN